MVSQPTLCAFCGVPGATKQHIWPKWLNTTFYPRASHHLELIESTLPVEGTPSPPHKIREGGANSRKIRNICKRCNNEWMSQLEMAAKPLVLPLITGKRVILEEFAQRRIAAWLTLI